VNAIGSDELQELRRLFPHTDKQIYFNHAAISPLSTRVKDAMYTYLESRSTGRIDDFESILAAVQETKELLGRLIGAEADEIAFMKNTSEGLNVIANGITWHEGDRVLLNDTEFPSNVYPFLNLKTGGVSVDFAKCSDGRIDLGTLEEALTDRTRLLSISHVSFLSGYRVDLDSLAALCRDRGVYLSVDAIQSVGAVPLDARGSGVDFVACGGHKWLMSPLGTGFLYIRRERLDDIRPVYLSWLSMKDPFDFLNYRVDLRDDAGRFEYSALNMSGITGMKAAVTLFLEVGIDRIERHIFSLLEYLRGKLGEMGLEVLSSFPPHESSGILLFRVPDPDGLAAKLSSENITISLRAGAVRVSPHFYNSLEEMDTFTTVLKRFL